MKLTKTAWRTYLALISLNLLIIFAAFQTYNYYSKNTHLPIPADAVKNLIVLVNKLQKNPQEKWPTILQRRSVPWSTLSLSTKPMYTKNALLTLQPALVFNLIKQHHALAISVFVNKDTWLNITMTPPVSIQSSAFINLLIVLLLAFFIVNFLIVKGLNQPIQTLIQSLEDTALQENWSSIPLTGNVEQQAILQKINTLQKKLHKLLANRTRVVAAISHDLRTPLTRLKLRVENLEDEKSYQKMMHDIQDMEIMIRYTLDYFQDIHQAEQPQPFDLVAMLNSIKEDTLEAGGRVYFSADTDKLVYIGSVNLLKRALNNIITNAIYYGGLAKISLKHTKKKIEIWISDQGPGLPASKLEKIFLPFYRAEQSRSRSTGGTGLGLTIAKEIIETHKGSISMENLKEGGLRAVICLPR
ncbi:sensor histidine kinase [Legionella beliardensis]|uniref:histidine kinase n=1 Tax=Legionella beliardensis TaxID=91822 RepID=A0A378I0P4_9GAMM|nr:ATP-binding protein [Legionella beliardensis]STX28553.1 sensor histidine kinase [Legionella beliardensis]